MDYRTKLRILNDNSLSNFDVKAYWEKRYGNGGTSGWGSHNPQSVLFKSSYINELIKNYSIKTIVELGCGDGNQLEKFVGYDKYYGYDISTNILDNCRLQFIYHKNIEFVRDINELFVRKYDLVLSLDVVYHLVDDILFEKHINDLFTLSNIITLFTTNIDETVPVKHIKNRCVTEYINKKNWDYTLIDVKMFNKTLGFFTYKKK